MKAKTIIHHTLICIIFCIGVLPVFGRTTKTPEDTALLNFVWVLKDYVKRSGGKNPLSWKELNTQMEAVYPKVFANARKYLDIENRYVFLQEQPEFMIRGKREKFIMMATDGELEGATGGGKPRPGRYVIVEQENGQLGARRYSEVALNRIFSENGLDLNKYTKKRVFQPSPKPTVRKSEREVLPAETPEERQRYRQTVKDRKHVVATQQESESDHNTKKYWIITMIALLITGAWVYMRIKAKRSRS